MIFMSFVFFILGCYGLVVHELAAALFCFAMIFFIRYCDKQFDKRHEEYLRHPRSACKCGSTDTAEDLSKHDAESSGPNF